MKKLLQRDPLGDTSGYPNSSPRTYSVCTSAGTFDVEDDGRRRWAPGTPVPRDRQPNALLALARNAEAYERHVEEERNPRRQQRRRAA